MAIPKTRDKFWVTDPPATFDDEGNEVVLICVFSTRGLLKAFYKSQGIPKPERDAILCRRFKKFEHYCKQIGWQGIAIDPDPETGESHIIRFDGVVGIGAAAEGEDGEGGDDEEVDLAQAEAPADVQAQKPKKSKIITDVW